MKVRNKLSNYLALVVPEWEKYLYAVSTDDNHFSLTEIRLQILGGGEAPDKVSGCLGAHLSSF